MQSGIAISFASETADSVMSMLESDFNNSNDIEVYVYCSVNKRISRDYLVEDIMSLDYSLSYDYTPEEVAIAYVAERTSATPYADPDKVLAKKVKGGVGGFGTRLEWHNAHCPTLLFTY